jgi:hypothetical protein
LPRLLVLFLHPYTHPHNPPSLPSRKYTQLLPSTPNTSTMWPPPLEITSWQNALGEADQPFDLLRDGIRTPSPIPNARQDSPRHSRRHAHSCSCQHSSSRETYTNTIEALLVCCCRRHHRRLLTLSRPSRRWSFFAGADTSLRVCWKCCRAHERRVRSSVGEKKDV